MTLFTRKDTEKTERIYEGGIINLRVDTLTGPGGRKIKREFVEHNGGVVIACRPKPDQIILIKQYRYCVDEVLYELPAGRLEAGEEPLAAAKRELLEETGYEAKSWRELAPMYTAPGFCNEMLYLYEASDVRFVATNPDEDEEIEVLEMPLTEAWALITAGKVRDAKTIAGVGMLLVAQQSQ
ncbi:MAG: NUDIX hydrolase [Terriglobales bacterium]